MQEGLHHHAVFFGSVTQRLDLLRCRLGSFEVKVKVDRLEPYRHILGHAQSSPEVEVPFHGDVDPFHRNTHGSSHHLSSDLGAGRERSEQQVSRAGSGAGSAHSQMSLCLAYLVSNLDRAGERGVPLHTVRHQPDAGCVGSLPILLLEWLLQLADVHPYLPIWCTTVVAAAQASRDLFGDPRFAHVRFVTIGAMAGESEEGTAPDGGFDQHWRDLLNADRSALPTITRAISGLYRRLPGSPRCKSCRAPFSGPASPVLRLLGVKPWPLNERLCAPCYKGLGQKLGGAEVPVSLLYADVRGSTALAEQTTPTELRSLLNRFFKKVLAAVESEDGVIDHIVGDGVMAMWVPVWSGHDHPRRAVAAGRKVVADLAIDQTLRASLPAGVGVHTGTAWVGVVGETGKHDFTVVGDTPNTVARLGSAAGGGQLVMSGAIVEAARVDTSSLDRKVLELKGKSEPFEIWIEEASRLPA